MRVDYKEYVQSAAWQQRAEAAKQRAGHRCQICNRPSERVILEVHHRTYERLGDERPEDLTVLCRGCHELYETNRRMPRPPQAEPVQQPPKEKATSTCAQQRPTAVASVRPHPLFAPARQNQQRSSAQAQLQPGLPEQPDVVYQLTPNHPSDPSATRYVLALDEHVLPPTQQPKPGGANRQSYRPTRRNQIGVAIVIVLALFVVLGLFDATQPAPNALLVPTPMHTDEPPATLALPATVADEVIISSPTPTPAPPTPTLAPTPQPFTATPTAVPTEAVPSATERVETEPGETEPGEVEPAQNIVIQTGLVCGTPCSCAPVVRTITRGEQVTIIDTVACRGDTWYQIGEQEWVGPRVIDLGP